MYTTPELIIVLTVIQTTPLSDQKSNLPQRKFTAPKRNAQRRLILPEFPTLRKKPNLSSFCLAPFQNKTQMIVPLNVGTDLERISTSLLLRPSEKKCQQGLVWSKCRNSDPNSWSEEVSNACTQRQPKWSQQAKTQESQKPGPENSKTMRQQLLLRTLWLNTESCWYWQHQAYVWRNQTGYW